MRLTMYCTIPTVVWLEPKRTEIRMDACMVYPTDTSLDIDFYTSKDGCVLILYVLRGLPDSAGAEA